MSDNVIRAVCTALKKLASDKLCDLVDIINSKSDRLQNHQLILLTFVSTYLYIYIKNTLFDRISPHGFIQRIKYAVFGFVKKLPPVAKEINRQVSVIRKDIESSKDFNLKKGQIALLSNYQRELNHDAKSTRDVLDDIDVLYKADQNHYDPSTAKFSGSMYSNEKEIALMCGEIYKRFVWYNPLHPEIFPNGRKLEAEVVNQVLRLYNGDPKRGNCGLFTSGGTESIFLAVCAYRNAYREKNGWGINTRVPEMVLPVTAHPAFNKAANYLGVRVKIIPVNYETQKVELFRIKNAITSSTCMVVGSAPNYPYGIFDPIVDLAAYCFEKNVGFHVDSCLGGFLVPFAHSAGFTNVPIVDFRLKGVTSISCDTHKYGCTPKGSSIVMFRDASLRKSSLFAYADWPGGLYATPTIAGSRAGVNAVMTWAVLRKIGHSGYVERAKEVLTLTKKMWEIAEKIDGLVMYPKGLQTIAFRSDKFSIFQFVEAMNEKGWAIQILQFPTAAHIGLTFAHCLRGEILINEWEEDLTQVAKKLIVEGDGVDNSEKAAIYGSTQAIPDRSLVNECIKIYTEASLALNEYSY